MANRADGQEIRLASYETRTELVCPWCDTFQPHFGAINVFDDHLIYECHMCFKFFTIPKEGRHG